MEKNLFHLAVCGAIFMIAYELGQRKAREQRTVNEAAAASDPMAWFANYGGLWKS
jgi:hypothetical protein